MDKHQDAFTREQIHGRVQPMEEPLDLAAEWRSAAGGILVIIAFFVLGCTIEWWLPL